MLKDIQSTEIPNIAVAAIQEFNENQIPEWYIYFINYSGINLSGVLISSKGWGNIDGKEKETSVLRHFLDHVDAMSYQKVEAIQSDVFCLYNQYWMSGYANDYMIDYKFIFEPNSIDADKLEMVSLINQKGIILYAQN
jgi:hypothetical protein